MSDYKSRIENQLNLHNARKICPVPRAGVDVDNVYYSQCVEAVCAWWDDLKQCCAVLTIARAARQEGKDE